MASITKIVNEKSNKILFDSDDIQIVKKNKNVDLSNHRVGEELEVSQNELKELLQQEEEPEQEHDEKVINEIKISKPDDQKFFMFVTDCKMTKELKDTLSLYSPIIEYSDQLFANRDIANLQSRGIRSVWVSNRTYSANRWVQHNSTRFRDECVILAVYTKHKTQKFLSQLNPNVVIRKSDLRRLAVLSIEELLEHLSTAGSLSLSAGFLERLMPCVYSRHINRPKSKN